MFSMCFPQRFLCRCRNFLPWILLVPWWETRREPNIPSMRFSNPPPKVAREVFPHFGGESLHVGKVSSSNPLLNYPPEV